MMASMLLHTVDPDPQALLDLYATENVDHLRANFVTTLDGHATGSDHRSGSINSPADKAVFSALRVLADAVIIGAGTLRAEGYRQLRTRGALLDLRRGLTDGPHRDHPALVVVTASGEVPEEVLAAGPPGSDPGHGGVIVICPESTPTQHLTARLGEDAVLQTAGHTIDPVEAVATLRSRGHRRLLTEGGPTLFGAWAGAGVVDELCLTIRPTVQGGPDGVRILEGTGPLLPAEATITQVLAIEGDLMLRVALR